MSHVLISTFSILFSLKAMVVEWLRSASETERHRWVLARLTSNDFFKHFHTIN